MFFGLVPTPKPNFVRLIVPTFAIDFPVTEVLSNKLNLLHEQLETFSDVIESHDTT